MANQSWVQMNIASLVDGAALTASITATSILPGGAKFNLYSNFFDKVGKKIRVRAMGRITTVVTTPGTLTLDLRMGPTSNIVVANGGAMALNIVAKTNLPWWLEWDLTCRAIGTATTANLMHQGLWMSEAVIGSPLPAVGGAGSFLVPATAPAVGTGFDSTVSMILDLFATWSINNANSITCHQFDCQELN